MDANVNIHSKQHHSQEKARKRTETKRTLVQRQGAQAHRNKRKSSSTAAGAQAHRGTGNYIDKGEGIQNLNWFSGSWRARAPREGVEWIAFCMDYLWQVCRTWR
jgi:hypothetical protein